MFNRNRIVDSVLTGALGYALILGWSACMGGGGGGGGLLPDGGSGGSGGGSIIPEALAEKSGTRLKARRLHGGDGSSEFQAWVDVARGGETCSFRATTEGKLRCLPSAGLSEGFYSHDDYYADPACTVPVVDSDASCEPPKYVFLVDDETSCSSQVAAVHVALPVTSVFRQEGTDGCNPFATSASKRYHAAGDPVALSDFVEGQASVEP